MNLSPIERAMGRPMRGPDGHPDPAPTGDEPKGDEPKGDEPKGDEPKGDEPKGDEPKGDEPKGDEPKGDASKDDEDLFGAPEGDYELKMEGDVAIDSDVLGFIAPLAKELNLSNAGLQKLTDVYTSQVQPHLVEQIIKGVQEDSVSMKETWAEEAEAFIAEDAKAEKAEDRVFGGKNLETVKKISAKFLDKFADDDFRKFLDESGLGNRHEMLAIGYRVGSLIGEDTEFSRGGGPKPTLTREEKYYGKT